MAKKQYTAEELYKKAFGPSKWATPEEINETQKQMKDASPEEILLKILKDKILLEKDVITLYPMLCNIKKIYMWLHDDVKVAQTEELLADLDPIYWEEFHKTQEERGKRAAKMMGISYEDLESIRKKAADEVHADDSWIKELDKKNRAKAGIE